MLSDVIDAIATDFVARTVPCTFFMGKEFVWEHALPPRIVVLPLDDSFGAPTKLGGSNPRSVATRHCGAAVHVWGMGAAQANPSAQYRADLAAVEALLHQFILSLHRSAPGIYALPGGGHYDTELVVRAGLVYTLRIAVDVPVVDIPWQTIPADSHAALTIQEVNPVTGATQTEFQST